MACRRSFREADRVDARFGGAERPLFAPSSRCSRACESLVYGVPRIERAEKAEPYRDQILEWVDRCRGNLVRVHEELVAQGVTISYPALTAFCRRHRIGHAPPTPAGHYDFEPAQEMQHDTSPHRAPIGGVEQRVDTASLVLCYSRMLFFQAYPVFTRFCCKGLPDRRPREQKR